MQSSPEQADTTGETRPPAAFSHPVWNVQSPHLPQWLQASVVRRFRLLSQDAALQHVADFAAFIPICNPVEPPCLRQIPHIGKTLLASDYLGRRLQRWPGPHRMFGAERHEPMSITRPRLRRAEPGAHDSPARSESTVMCVGENRASQS